MARDANQTEAPTAAHSVYVRLLLPPYTVHFKSPTYLKPATLDLLDKKICKETVKSTAQDVSIRMAIGGDDKFWAELVVLLRAAVPSLERRSFAGWEPGNVDYESTSGALIAASYPGLWKDLERLNDLISIGRNVLTIGERAQDSAAEHLVDLQVFRLINCCVRVTARGYDGDAGTGEEEKWQWVVNAYKKLLITSLQFLNNLVAQNERRKLLLWVSLFDGAHEAVQDGLDKEEASRDRSPPPPPAAPAKPIPPITQHDVLLAYGTSGASRISPLELEGAQPLYKSEGFKPLPPLAVTGQQKFEPNGYVYFVHETKDILVADFLKEHGRSPMLAEIHLNLPWYWYEDEREMGDVTSIYTREYKDALTKYKNEMIAYEKESKALPPPPPKPRLNLNDEEVVKQDPKEADEKLKVLQEELVERYKAESEGSPDGDMSLAHTLFTRGNERDDMRMLFTADAGAKILESGKAELMKRLEGYGSEDASGAKQEPSQLTIENAPPTRTRSASGGSRDPKSASTQTVTQTQNRTRRVEHEDTLAEDIVDEDEEEESDEEGDEDEEDYPGSTEDGRGLLTDVPLILGPSEIEVLPMLIMSGIVSQDAGGDEDQPVPELNNTHTLRTHLLLSQTSGRNLLRELLIFVAAWDLREEELYFKFMVKILEAILKNGLMPYAYHAFRDRSRSKDIISPAQAVIMKLLTCIFRGRGEAVRAAVSAHPSPSAGLSDGDGIARPSQVDLHILNFIFTEFRQHIIPQTCALIFLQGQIHAGRASPEDFPLNLWDMERMYEGVYQYLEFFAVLTEEFVHAAKGKSSTIRQIGNDLGTLSPAVSNAWWSWKTILAEWEMASELVTLLRELEGGIPAFGAPVQDAQHPVPQQHRHGPVARSLSADAVLTVPSSHGGDSALKAAAEPADSNGNPIFEAATPLAYPPEEAHAHSHVRQNSTTDNASSLVHTCGLEHSHHVHTCGLEHTASHGDGSAPLPSPHDLRAEHDQDEPSDFEWRNLKKLTVLVLSSLLWKNTLVQKQVRECGGLQALMACCQQDENNPYIQDHAIICLRFAVDGCRENEDVVRAGTKVNGKFAHLVTMQQIIGARVPEEAPNASVVTTDGQQQLNQQMKDTLAINVNTELSSGLARVADEQLRELIEMGRQSVKGKEGAASLGEWRTEDVLRELNESFKGAEKALGGIGGKTKG